MIWLMNGASYKAALSTWEPVATGWNIAGAADFNGDGQTEIFGKQRTGQRVIWLMNGTSYSSFVDLGTVGIGWNIANH